jgi:hypothetical protein
LGTLSEVLEAGSGGGAEGLIVIDGGFAGVEASAFEGCAWLDEDGAGGGCGASV